MSSSSEQAPPLPTSGPPEEVCDGPADLSSLRLEADLTVESTCTNFLQPLASLPKRRRSPVTVQEWVASLPVPHLLSVKGYDS